MSSPLARFLYALSFLVALYALAQDADWSWWVLALVLTVSGFVSDFAANYRVNRI